MKYTEKVMIAYEKKNALVFFTSSMQKRKVEKVIHIFK